MKAGAHTNHNSHCSIVLYPRTKMHESHRQTHADTHETNAIHTDTRKDEREKTHITRPRVHWHVRPFLTCARTPFLLRVRLQLLRRLRPHTRPRCHPSQQRSCAHSWRLSHARQQRQPPACETQLQNASDNSQAYFMQVKRWRSLEDQDMRRPSHDGTNP